MTEGYTAVVKDWFEGVAVPWLATTGLKVAWNLMVSALVLLAGWMAIKFVDRLLRRAFAKVNKKALLINFVVSVVTKSCWVILIVTVLSRLGVDVAPLVAGIGVTGFIVGFACQESLANLAAGVMIAINEPFKIGDFVEATGLSGTVVEVNMMATVMTTADNKKIVLPNKGVWGAPITNYSAMPTRRVDLEVGVSYGADAGKAVLVIAEIVRGVPGVLASPAPKIAISGLDESQVTISVRPWCSSSDYWSVRAATLEAVKAGLESAGIEIPYPQLVVHQG